MSKSVILINCQLGKENDILNALANIDEVTTMQQTFGAYDIVCEVECPTLDEMREVITFKIRKHPDIRSTVTLTVVNEDG